MAAELSISISCDRISNSILNSIQVMTEMKKKTKTNQIENKKGSDIHSLIFPLKIGKLISAVGECESPINHISTECDMSVLVPIGILQRSCWPFGYIKILIFLLPSQRRYTTMFQLPNNNADIQWEIGLYVIYAANNVDDKPLM